MRIITDKNSGHSLDQIGESVFEGMIEEDLVRMDYLRLSDKEEKWWLQISRLEDDRFFDEEIVVPLNSKELFFPKLEYWFTVENFEL